MNKNYLIIVGILIIIACLIIGIAFTMMNNVNAYTNFTCNDTGTRFEVPVDLKVRQDMSVEGIRSTTMSTPDGDIVIERQVGDNPYIDDTLEGARDLLNSYNGDKVNGIELHTCSRTAKNEATGEVIMVTSNSGDNETVEHIINSIKWGNKTVSNNNTSSNSVSSSVSSNVSSSDNDSDDKAKYTADDLKNARDMGYTDGYFDGYDDSLSEDYAEYESSGGSNPGVETTSDSSTESSIVSGSLE